jgi:hypothetical protein
MSVGIGVTVAVGVMVAVGIIVVSSGLTGVVLMLTDAVARAVGVAPQADNNRLETVIAPKMQYNK